MVQQTRLALSHVPSSRPFDYDWAMSRVKMQERTGRRRLKKDADGFESIVLKPDPTVKPLGPSDQLED